MNDQPAGSTEKLTATFRLVTAEWKLEGRMPVPKGPTTLRELLPVIQDLTDAMVRDTADTVERQGQQISCHKGCGACCSQLVPISTVDARRIRDVIDEMPEPRRSEIRARFAAARQRFADAGMLEDLRHSESWTDEDTHARDLAYFAQGVPCPFLEAGSCSIYADRPLTCRTYLVTSPAANCAQPSRATIAPVKMPLKVAAALARCDPPMPAPGRPAWIPLILAPQWAEAHPHEPPGRTGPDLLRELIGHLTGQSPPGERETLTPCD